MAEDGLQHSRSSKNNEFISTNIILAKVGEVVLAIVALFLIYIPFNDFQRTPLGRRTPTVGDMSLIYITLGSFLMINVVFIIYHGILRERIPKRLSLIFSSLAALLHLISAILIIHNWQRVQGELIQTYNNNTYGSRLYLNMLIFGSIFSFLTTAAFVAEIYVHVERRSKEQKSVNSSIPTLDYFSKTT